MKTQTFVVIKDRFGSKYADTLDVDIPSIAAVSKEAKEMCQRSGIDDEYIQYGIVSATDAGAARIMPDHAITWIGDFDASNLG